MPKVIWDTGVYCWLNTVNGKRYVGSGSGNGGMESRLRGHLKALRKGQHSNRYLQSSWNKHGEVAFEFLILERCYPYFCLEREQYWMDLYKAADRGFGYNLSPTAGNNKGIKFGPMSEEDKKKHSEALLGRKLSQEECKKMSERVKRDWEDPKKRLNMIAGQKKRSENREWREKLSEAAKLRPPMSEETRSKLSEAGKGRNPSKETRKHLSDGVKKAWEQLSDGDREKRRKAISLSLKGREQSEEHREKNSLKNRGECNQAAKLIESDVMYIRKNYYRSGKRSNVRWLAKKFEVSVSLIRQIVRGERWRHVDPPRALILEKDE